MWTHLKALTNAVDVGAKLPTKPITNTTLQNGKTQAVTQCGSDAGLHCVPTCAALTARVLTPAFLLSRSGPMRVAATVLVVDAVSRCFRSSRCGHQAAIDTHDVTSQTQHSNRSLTNRGRRSLCEQRLWRPHRYVRVPADAALGAPEPSLRRHLHGS